MNSKEQFDNFKEGFKEGLKMALPQIKEVNAVVEKFEIRKRISIGVIEAYKDFEKDYTNGLLHQSTMSLENGLNIYFQEDPNAENRLISKVQSYLGDLPLPHGVDANKFKRDLAKIGLDTLRVELKVFNVNQKTKALKRFNQIDESELADKILIYAENLKKEIEKSKENHLEVKKALSTDSLEGLEKASKLINPDAVNYNENLDQEIEDFLNGGDLIL